jgi:hypothetical protein
MFEAKFITHIDKLDNKIGLCIEKEEALNEIRKERSLSKESGS